MMTVNIGTEARYRAVRAAPPCRIVAIFSAAEPDLARYMKHNAGMETNQLQILADQRGSIWGD